ncbi:MAG: UPF0179 family protein [Thermoproteaceae archaeon]|jgi:uncharacterized protein (UPF0179 family)|nr:UPF0179 family protein [Thermoproteaceae archaeon]
MRRVVTLISREQAVTGHRFRVVAVPAECRACKLYSVCMGRLAPGLTYRIVSVRQSMGQRCRISGSEMVPVVVEPCPLVGLVPAHKALEGVIVTFEGECAGCEGCPLDVVKPGAKIKILKLLGRVECRGRPFAVVEFYVL